MQRQPKTTIQASLTIAATAMFASCWLAFCAGSARAESVNIDIPSAVSFAVDDATQTTVGSPNPFSITYSGASLDSGNELRLSVMASSTTFTAPAGVPIPASNVSWTIGSVTNGVGAPGTLTADSFTQVYVSDPNAVSGGVDIIWSLAPPPAGVRAGQHTLSVTWKIESVTP